MLGTKNRLSKNKDFRYIYRRGKNSASNTSAMVYIKSRINDELLIGFSISRKVANAVERNRIKRVMRENIRFLIDDIKSGHRIIFIARASANNASYQKIGNDLKRLLSRAKLLDTDKLNGKMKDVKDISGNN